MNDEIKPRTVYLLRRTDRPDDGTDIYVGSMSRALKKRLCEHNVRAIGNETSKLYKRMREVGLDNWEILPLLVFTCEKLTILGFEKMWINTLNADLNTLSPITTPDERKEQKANYYVSNKEALLKYQANYYESNKEAIKQHHINYYELNKVSILRKKMNHYESNKEAIRQQRANYRESTKQNRVHYCDVCNKSFEFKKDLQRHFESLKHQYTYLNFLD